MKTLKERAAAALKAAQDIVDGAKADGRENLTAAEESEFNSHIKDLRAIRLDIVKADEQQDRFQQLAKLAPEFTTGGSGRGGFLKFDTKAMARRLVSSDESGRPQGVKALLETGSQIVGTPMVEQTPVSLGKPATSLLDVLPVKEVPRDFSYLTQTVRTNAAAPVAVGAVKPTSTYTMQRVESRLRVIAHLSEPVDKYWLEDNVSLAQWVSDELLYGLYLALIGQVVSGAGTGENFVGLTNVSGTQTQTFATDAILTTRTALNKIELLGYEGLAYVLHPNDWLTIETKTITTGQYLFGEAGAPVDRVARRLWGVPVVLANAVTPGQGFLLAKDSVTLFIDGKGVVVEWAMSGDDFNRNQIRARCEGRFQLGVLRPISIVKMTLTGP